jgi:hypothetical protein
MRSKSNRHFVAALAGQINSSITAKNRLSCDVAHSGLRHRVKREIGSGVIAGFGDQREVELPGSINPDFQLGKMGSLDGYVYFHASVLDTLPPTVRQPNQEAHVICVECPSP